MAARIFRPQYVAPTTVMGSGSACLSTVYGASRMWLNNPRRPTRSADNDPPNVGGDKFTQKYDAGANGLWVADTIVSFCNFRGPSVQFNASDVWTSPSVDQAIDHSATTITLSGATLAGCKLTYASLNATPGALAGKVFSCSAGNFAITDNTATEFWCQGNDIDGATGTGYILEPRKIVTGLSVEYRYARVVISTVQTTINGTFDIILAMGRSLSLNARQKANPGTYINPVSDSWNLAGQMFRRTLGPRRREWTVSLVRPTVAERNQFTAMLDNAGQMPLVFIPDDTVTTDWAFVFAGNSTRWDAKKTTVELFEVA